MNQKSGKPERRREKPLWRWYFRGAFFTLLAVIATASLCWNNLFPSPSDRARQVQEEKSGLPKVNSLRWLTLLEQGFSGHNLLVAVLADYQPDTGAFTLCVLPGNLWMGQETLAQAYAHGGGAGALTALTGTLGVQISHYAALEAQQLYEVTKTYGNLIYRLNKPLSRYDPQTGDAFLAAEGTNSATGLDFCKLTELTIQADLTEGCNLTASRLGSYLTSNLRTRTPSQKGFSALLGRCSSNLSAADYNSISAGLADLMERGIPQVLVISGSFGGTSASAETSTELSMENSMQVGEESSTQAGTQSSAASSPATTIVSGDTLEKQSGSAGHFTLDLDTLQQLATIFG